MKQPERPPHLQLNLSLRNRLATAISDGKQRELTLALVELLLGAAGEGAQVEAKGGSDESETNA